MNQSIRIFSATLIVMFFSSNVTAEEEKKSKWGFINKFKESVEDVKDNFTNNNATSEKDKTEKKYENSKIRNEKGSEEIDPTKQISEMKNQIMLVQQLLQKKGFDPGVADGIPGEKTRNAICQYQYSQELNVNPQVTSALIENLKSTPSKITIKKFNDIVRAQCDVAHINNVNHVNSVVNHVYEGALTPADLMCTEVVSPYSVEKNFDLLATDLVKNITDIFNRDKSELNLDSLKIKAKQANWLPYDVELMYGKKLHEKRMEMSNIFSRDNKRTSVKKLYEQADEVLAKVLASIDEEYPYEFKLFVVDDKGINAEALPGGYIYVNSGVLETEIADLVLSHEIAHILRRHTTKELQAALVDSVETLDDLKNIVSNKSKDPVLILEKVLVLRGALVQYSQQQELQSDACAVRLAAAENDVGLEKEIDQYISAIKNANIDIARESSSHPVYAERHDRMHEVYEKLNKQVAGSNMQ